jgi:glucosamine--fructose-6-phosphate aminotransferase (isomerizing)
MEPMHPAVMIDQVQDLPNVMREQLRPFDSIVRSVLTPLEYLSLRRVFLTGDGDSYHASMAVDLAFKSIARIPCEPMSAQRFLDYAADFSPVPFPNSALVVGTSASGKTQRVVQAIECAKKQEALTIALTGTPDSPVTKVADRTIAVQVPDRGPSPGIRTYTASLMGLLLLAIRIGELKDRYHQDVANEMRREIAGLADVVQATIQACKTPALQAAAALKVSPMMIFLGSGPSYGTAMFSAAKSVEAAAVFAVGQDLEEYWHVERFALPSNIPTFIIAPPGRSHWRAVDLADTVKKQGRRLVAVVKEDDLEMTSRADFVLPVVGEVREEFTPLVYHIAGDLFASYLADALGRKLFQSDNAAFREAMMAGPAPQPQQ